MRKVVTYLFLLTEFCFRYCDKVVNLQRKYLCYGRKSTNDYFVSITDCRHFLRQKEL